MTDPRDTPEGRERRLIDQEISQPQTGTVTKVYEHTTSSDRWNYHVDVRIGPEWHPRRIPFAVPFADLAAPPRSASHPDGPDLVLVQYMNDAGTERPIVTNVLYNDEDRPPVGQEGIFRFRRGNMYIEVHPNGDWARLAKKGGDTVDPDLNVEVRDDSTNQEINILASGKKVNIDADLVEVNDGTNYVATEGDTVSGTTSDGATFSGTIDDKTDGDIEVSK